MPFNHSALKSLPSARFSSHTFRKSADIAINHSQTMTTQPSAHALNDCEAPCEASWSTLPLEIRQKIITGTMSVPLHGQRGIQHRQQIKILISVSHAFARDDCVSSFQAELIRLREENKRHETMIHTWVTEGKRLRDAGQTREFL